MIKEVGKSIVDIVNDYEENGNFAGGEVFDAGMGGGYVAVAYGADDQEQLVSDELKAELDASDRKANSGDLVVDTAL